MSLLWRTSKLSATRTHLPYGVWASKVSERTVSSAKFGLATTTKCHSTRPPRRGRLFMMRDGRWIARLPLGASSMEKKIRIANIEECDSLDSQLEMWVRGVLAMRKRRNNTFGTDLFSDQSWDLILLLAIAPSEGSTRSELASASERSNELTQRWLCALIHRNLVLESVELRFRLTPNAREMLRSILS